MSGGCIASAAWPLVGIGGHGTAVIREDAHYLLLLSHLIFAADRADRSWLAHGLGLNLLPTAASWQVPRVWRSERVSLMSSLLHQVGHARRLLKATLDSRAGALTIGIDVVASLHLCQLLSTLCLNVHVIFLCIGQVALAKAIV